ncbi:MAG TPA: Xaa-Pro peptidase family protein [Actinomycetota bacterium]|nr:Xaa-Pro peptidase family protein [Actinomycetota bacterium]
MATPFGDRLHRATGATHRAKLAALLVTPSADLKYLTGYDPPPFERITCLVVRPGADPVLLVPELERSRAAASPAGEGIELVGWRDGEDPYQMLARLLPDQGRFAVNDSTWAVHLLGFQKAVPSATWRAGSAVVSELRMRKDPQELELLSRAGRGADEAFRRITALRMNGMREEEVAAALAELLTEHGHDTAEFTIVASGPNGASPHHEPGSRSIRAGEEVVLDFGGTVGGYYSDMTRTVVVEKPPRGFGHVYDIVREAQEAAFQAVRPGVAAEDVDAAAREAISMAGYADRFIHRTGHGIGLEVHEDPYIVAGNRRILEPGMCFSIEPGIYLDGRFGVRIEDIVTVTETGAQRLNRASRDLETVA